MRGGTADQRRQTVSIFFDLGLRRETEGIGLGEREKVEG